MISMAMEPRPNGSFVGSVEIDEASRPGGTIDSIHPIIIPCYLFRLPLLMFMVSTSRSLAIARLDYANVDVPSYVDGV